MKRSIAPVALACASLAIPTLMASQAPSATAVEPLLRASFDAVSVKLDEDPAAQMGIRPVD